jgi:hypothetical protein
MQAGEAAQEGGDSRRLASKGGGHSRFDRDTSRVTCERWRRTSLFLVFGGMRRRVVIRQFARVPGLQPVPRQTLPDARAFTVLQRAGRCAPCPRLPLLPDLLNARGPVRVKSA